MTFLLFAVIALLVYALIAWLISQLPSSGGLDSFSADENRSFKHRYKHR